MKMNETRRLLRNTGIIAIGNLSAKVVTFFLLPLYTAILSTEEYGVIDYLITLSAFSVPCISLLMDESIFRFLIDCKNDGDKIKIISNSLFLVFCGIVIFCIFAIPVLWYLQYTYTIILLLLIFSELISTLLSALLRGIGAIEAFSIYNFLSTVLQIILNVLFVAVFYWGIIGMVSALIVGRIVPTIIYIYILKLWNFLQKEKIDRNEALILIKYSLPLIPNKISWLIINLFSRIAIMTFMSSSFVGIYAIASKFPIMMDTVYGFFYQSWKESSARVLKDNDQNEFYNFVYKYLKQIMYTIVLLIISCMPFLFKILIADAYSEALQYVPILIVATYFANMAGFYGGIFTAYKNTNIMGSTTIVAAIIDIIFMITFIEGYGLYAISAAALISNFVVYQYRKIKVKKYIALKENIIKVILDWIITGVIIAIYYSMNLFIQIIGVIIAFVYAGVINKDIIKLAYSRMKYDCIKK